jgi:hypothetical protein
MKKITLFFIIIFSFFPTIISAELTRRIDDEYGVILSSVTTYNPNEIDNLAAFCLFKTEDTKSISISMLTDRDYPFSSISAANFYINEDHCLAYSIGQSLSYTVSQSPYKVIYTAYYIVEDDFLNSLKSATTIEFSFKYKGSYVGYYFSDSTLNEWKWVANMDLYTDPYSIKPWTSYIKWSHNDYNVDLSWLPIPGATGYMFYFDPTSEGAQFDGNWQYEMDFKTLTSLAITLPPGSCYKIAVKPYNTVGIADISNIETVCLP